jgi:hypothetical protein
MPIIDARTLTEQPTLEREGIALHHHRSSVADWRDGDALTSSYLPEVCDLIHDLTGADAVVIMGRAVLRFSERSEEAGRHDNSLAARFIHIDASDTTARNSAAQLAPAGRIVRRSVQHNIWRTFSGAPQDVPLTVCDARSVAQTDLVPADAIFDSPGVAEWSFEALLLRYNPAHRWLFFANMQPDEVLIFKRHDSEGKTPCQVPHTAFTDATTPDWATPRCSVEARTIAYWFD